MTVKAQTENLTLQAEIPVAFLRYLEGRTDERVIEVVLVYNGVDRFDTIIEPTGMKTDPNIVNIDYNHNRISTGAYLRNTRVVENYKLEDGTVLEQALIGDIHIPKDAEMFHRNKNGEKVTAGNLYEAVSKGHVRSVSVEFRPYKGKQVTDTETGITTYREWDLINLSVLDVAPGQPYSGIKITRNMQITINDVQTALEAGSITQEELNELTRNITITKDEVVADVEEGETAPTDEEVEEEVDTNEDGEISEEEMRAYIKEIKRSFDDPKMIAERMDAIERMCGELKERMEAKPETEEDLEEKEAQRIRAINTDLEESPEEETVELSGEKQVRQLENPEAPKEEETRFTPEQMEAMNLKSKLVLNQIK